ncbi:MAG: hypothetical protein AAF236_15675, partial [Verrucomicrobiota bacterium]
MTRPKNFVIALGILFSFSATNPADAQEKPADQMTADEVLRLVRYSYTLYNRDFTGNLRQGIKKKVPFMLSLKPEAIRFI